MKKFTFNTIGLFTSDNKKMVDFYRDIMGFTTDWNGEEPNVMMRHKDIWLIIFRESENDTPERVEMYYQFNKLGFCTLFPQ